MESQVSYENMMSKADFWGLLNDNLGDEERKYGVRYTDFVDLLNFEGSMADERFEEALRFSSSDDWKEQFFAIDVLRRLNKYFPEVLENRIMESFQFIETCIHSPRTYLGKNTLIFIQEIYMQPRSESLIHFTREIVPILETKTAHESAFIRIESTTALQF